jgi:hypothetical protein
MQHRLFHTLVIGGLLTGCGSVAELAPEPATPTPDGQPFPNVDAAPAVPDAGFDGNSPIEAGARPDGGPELRACEGGWPTTKGCSFPTPGVMCCQNECCLRTPPEETPDAGGDEVQP